MTRRRGRGFQAGDGIDYVVARYLSSCGLCRDPDDIMEDPGPAGMPAVFCAFLPPEPAAALAIRPVGEQRDFGDESTPVFDVQITLRGERGDRIGLDRMAAGVFAALHDQTDYELVAGRRCLLSRRVIYGPPVEDTNRRWLQTDTYRLRMAADPTLF